MATRHYLALDVLDTAQPTVLRLSDASIYAPLLEVACPWLDVLVPGASEYVRISDLPTGFVTTLTAHELGLQPSADGLPACLPDGLYRLAYAVAPQEKTRITKLHLRTTLLENRIYKALCSLQPSDCEISQEQSQKLQQLRHLQLYLQAAKAQAEHCDAPESAMAFYHQVERLLARYSRRSCPTCLPLVS